MQMYMLKKAANQVSILILYAILCYSCVNLKAVGIYSHEAIAGLQQFERLPYGFEMHCEATCLDINIRDRNVNPGPCDCSADKRADSINRVIYLATHDYFQDLAMLADNEKAQLNTAGLTGTLVAGNFGPISLNTEQVDAYSLLSNTLMRGLTDKLRSHKLSAFVAQAAGPIGTLLQYLDLNLAGNLYQKLEVRKRRLKGVYFDLANNPELSLYEQTKIVEDYYRNLEDLSVRQETLHRFSEIIKVMLEGHKKLAKQLENPKDSLTRQELSQAGSKLHATIKDFKVIGGWDN